MTSRRDRDKRNKGRPQREEPREPMPEGLDLGAHHFEEAEVRQLWDRFVALDADKSGAVSVVELVAMPEFNMYPLLRSIVAMYNATADGEITFPGFVQALSTLSGRASMEEKLRFAFSLYDLNKTGMLQKAEMFTVFRIMTGRQHEDNDLAQIVESYLSRFPEGISYDVFVQMFSVSDLSKLTLDLELGAGGGGERRHGSRRDR